MLKPALAVLAFLIATPALATGKNGSSQSQIGVWEPYEKPKPTQRVVASYYGHGERLARHTSTGEVFNALALTCAHRTLPFGTLLRVANGDRNVIVRVNDRGPAAYTGRSIDLSYGAALRIGLVPRGSGPVEIQVLN